MAEAETNLRGLSAILSQGSVHIRSSKSTGGVEPTSRRSSDLLFIPAVSALRWREHLGYAYRALHNPLQPPRQRAPSRIRTQGIRAEERLYAQTYSDWWVWTQQSGRATTAAIAFRQQLTSPMTRRVGASTHRCRLGSLRFSALTAMLISGELGASYDDSYIGETLPGKKE